MAKKADSPYDDNSAARNWIKIKNPSYSQKEGLRDDVAISVGLLCIGESNQFTFDTLII